MALTLDEAAKLSNDMLLQGVVETIVKDSPVLQQMPFIEIVGNVLTYNQEKTLPTTADSRVIDVSPLTDRVMVEAVEYPQGLFPPSYQKFTLWGHALTLFGEETPDGSDCNVYYGMLHTLDAEGTTIPTKFEDLIATGAAGYAAVEWAGYAINRVSVGGTTTPGEFLDWGNERLKQFRSEMKRLGRRNQVRIRQLYRR
jgi:hypothetical protein